MLFCTRAWNVKQWLSHSSGAEQAEIDSLIHCRTCLQHRKTFKKKKKKCIDSTNVETASYDERIGARCLYNCLCTLPHVRRHKLYRKRNGHRHTAVLVPHFALWHHTSSYCRVLHTARSCAQQEDMVSLRKKKKLREQKLEALEATLEIRRQWGLQAKNPVYNTLYIQKDRFVHHRKHTSWDCTKVVAEE